ncbi:MAG: hypothetical protein JST22_17710 [Bacteroidetes bacterium]|nr:hypothetical protein [Bacteroidota bacterium]
MQLETVRKYAGVVVALALFACSTAAAQSGVTVQLFQPPPNQLKIADLWRIKLVNNTQTTYTVCLFGTLDETALGKRLVDATTAQFRLPPGTKLITGSDIQPIDANYYDDRYKQIFMRTGQAPAGEYRICVEVRLECGAQVLARDCKDQHVQPLTPPVLIAPANESTVPDKLPTFSWLPPSPLGRGQSMRYELKIVEVLGRQTPYDAMGSNPAWFLRGQIVPTVQQYPISSRAFVKGNTYAWKIAASSDGIPMGESEIWWFIYNPTSLIGGNDGGGRIVNDSLQAHLTGSKNPIVPAYQPTTHGVITIDPTDIGTNELKFFGDPTKLIPDRIEVIPTADQLKKDFLEVYKELLRSCND